MSLYPEGVKLKWREFKALCESSGIRDDDEVDLIDVSWGDPAELKCEKDEDFGWQIKLRAG